MLGSASFVHLEMRYSCLCLSYLLTAGYGTGVVYIHVHLVFDGFLGQKIWILWKVMEYRII